MCFRCLAKTSSLLGFVTRVPTACTPSVTGDVWSNYNNEHCYWRRWSMAARGKFWHFLPMKLTEEDDFMLSDQLKKESRRNAIASQMSPILVGEEENEDMGREREWRQAIHPPTTVGECFTMDGHRPERWRIIKYRTWRRETEVWQIVATRASIRHILFTRSVYNCECPSQLMKCFHLDTGIALTCDTGTMCEIQHFVCNLTGNKSVQLVSAGCRAAS